MADGKCHSGEVLASRLSVSRTAVWKIIKELQSKGLQISATKGKGYRLETYTELLNKKEISIHIDKNAQSLISNLEIYQEVLSTNQLMLEQLGKNILHGRIITAEYQSAGYGRRGNAWCSPYAGSISLSIGWHYEFPLFSLMHLSMAIGIAVIKTLHRIGLKQAGLKWPNDIVYGDQKLGGLLIETRGESAGPCSLVAGIGLNYSIPNQTKGIDINQPWIDLDSIMDTLPSRNVLIAILISEVIPVLENFHNQKPQEYVSAWKKYDCLIGKKVYLKLLREMVQGTVEGFDNNGAIQISVHGKIKSYSSGEISIKMNA